MIVLRKVSSLTSVGRHLLNLFNDPMSLEVKKNDLKLMQFMLFNVRNLFFA